MPENITMPVGGTVNRTSHAQVKKQREETFVQKRKKKKKLFPRQKAVQDRYACIEGLTKMHMDHAMPICGRIMHLWLSQWFTSGDQNRCVGGDSPLNWAVVSALSTVNVWHVLKLLLGDIAGSYVGLISMTDTNPFVLKFAWFLNWIFFYVQSLLSRAILSLHFLIFVSEVERM